jgi:hypothetical protein
VHRVVAAIDYGTHGTGFAWTVIDNRNRDKARRDIYDRPDWPGGTRYPKTLSAVLTDDDGEILEWGNLAQLRHLELHSSGRDPGICTGHRHIQGMKMSLRPFDDPSRRRDAAPADGAPRAVADDLTDPLPVIGAFLARIREEALREITADGRYRPEDVRWCLTVPAIWDSKSLHAMRTAAGLAGFPTGREDLLLVPEPDAAALYCGVAGAHAQNGERTGSGERGLLGPGRRFVVVDCGGGTVDLVSYEVSSETAMEQLRRPTGGAYGAEYTTGSFLSEVLAPRLGGNLALRPLMRRHPRQFANIVEAWERERNAFRPDSTSDILVDIPSPLHRALDAHSLAALREAQDGEDGLFVIGAAEVRSLLDGSVDLLLPQLDDHLTAVGPGREPLVFLVGGFAQSAYLRAKVTSHVGERARVLVPKHPERAVLHGAVHYCYDPGAIPIRRSRYTYGFETNLPFEDRDDERRAWTDEEGRKKCKERFDIAVHADQKIAAGAEIVRNVLPVRSDQTSIDFHFHSTPEPAPRYVDGPETQALGTLTIDISDCMNLPWPERTVKLTMVFGDGDIAVAAESLHTGRPVHATLHFETTS